MDLPFQEYVEQLLHPQDPTSLGNGEPDLGSIGNGTRRSPLLPVGIPASHLLCWQTPCTFLETTTLLSGHHYSSTILRLRFAYWEPPLLTALGSQVGASSKQTWGSPYIYYVYQLSKNNLTGAGSGVPFHWHGPGFSEVIYGRKVSTRERG